MKRWRHSTNAQVAQVWKGTITTTTNGHTYTVTLTEDNGETAAITYTVVNPPDTTVTLVATGFITAWNASLNPIISKITATQSAGQIILTSDQAGIPFSAATSGTGTWSGTGNTTECVSNVSYSQATNFEDDAAPAANEDVVIPQGSVNISRGLNASGVALDTFAVEKNCRSQIGRWESGELFYLRIVSDETFTYKGNASLAAFDLGGSAISPYIESYGSPAAAGLHAVYLIGSALATVEVAKGNVGIAAVEGETATVATVICGYLNSPQSDVDLTIGSGTTLTTLNQRGGVCVLRCAATTVNVNGGTLTTEGTGAITTVNIYPGATAYLNSTGTVTTVNVWGTLDLTRDFSSRTLTTLVQKRGGKIRRHAGITLSNITVLAEPGSFIDEYV